MAEKKPLTIKQKYKRYKTYQYGLVGAEYFATLLPYGIMAIVNRDEWFTYNPDSWKVGLGGSIGIVLLALAMFLITKRKDNAKLTDGMIALVIGWYAITFVFFLLAQINMEIYKIMGYGGFGLIAALGLDIGSKHFEKKANDLKLLWTTQDKTLIPNKQQKRFLKKKRNRIK